jgi:hypothetical protein
MTAENTRPVTLLMGSRGTLVRVQTVGRVIAAAPGLVVTPWYADDPTGVGPQPVPGRFTLTHADSGQRLVPLPWCAHDVRRWAVAAGWIGVDWRAPAFTVCASGPAATFAWRLFDEWRAHCDACDPVPTVDDRTARLLRSVR